MLICKHCYYNISAEQTPLSALHAAAISIEAGIPAGVLNVVPGFGMFLNGN